MPFGQRPGLQLRQRRLRHLLLHRGQLPRRHLDVLLRVNSSLASAPAAEAAPYPGRGDLTQFVNAASAARTSNLFTFHVCSGSPAVDRLHAACVTQGSASLAAGQPPAAAVAEAGVANRHRWGTMAAEPWAGAQSWPTVNATSSAADDGFAKSARQAQTTISTTSPARKPINKCTYMFTNTPRRFSPSRALLLGSSI